MSAYCQINKNSGTAAVEGTIDFTQEVCGYSACHYTPPTVNSSGHLAVADAMVTCEIKLFQNNLREAYCSS